MSILVGGAGFIGSNFVFDWLIQSDEPVINIDKLTYAGNLESLASLQGDIGDAELIISLLGKNVYGQYLQHLLKEGVQP